MITSSGSARLRRPRASSSIRSGSKEPGAQPAHLVFELLAFGAHGGELLLGRFDVPVQLPPGEQPATADHGMIAEVDGEPVREHHQPVARFQTMQPTEQPRAHERDQRASARTPGNRATGPSSSSIRSSWLYLASRSERDIEPVLI